MMDKKHLLEFLLIHADTGNIIGHRLGEWCGHGPVLEQDLAMTNFALDHLGRARLLYQYAGEIDGNSKTEDDLAFLRFEYEYKNLLLAEFANTDFAFTVARQFFLDSYYMDLLEGLTNSTDQRIAQIATKSLKETSYHYKWSSEWLIRLGDGTEISHAKMQTAVNEIWEFTGEFFIPVESEIILANEGVVPSLELLKPKWKRRVEEIFSEATISIPNREYQQSGGKAGHHTEKLGYILADMQYMQRAFPGLNW
ncbi:MAG: phenylacetate-CoA oxygenase subunit PaaC [Saprospiraceae bacterium]|nr:phenylacetate-CoA oxygenase subunit PaaC [Candidatus Vicinibacter affinis]MBP6173883.1 phenylacetate-CoA oxygenase subunit PaaC [Saprospiraceae bacterium]MBK6573229.1 phenylacetate-CoA oxygenase subunit PaaC [Candidatus Vicinibacter affinis]MBK7301911.1 phenylacetate-CoA oxygenase subunit PaaC [Candidatus Vicinibacter affinis]MBK7693050.1 phenylacetate-CoA oxygenase subunit PaaC [Candidatus Vicinibacter affinis]